jgi:hypothetical protein
VLLGISLLGVAFSFQVMMFRLTLEIEYQAAYCRFLVQDSSAFGYTKVRTFGYALFTKNDNDLLFLSFFSIERSPNWCFFASHRFFRFVG